MRKKFFGVISKPYLLKFLTVGLSLGIITTTAFTTSVVVSHKQQSTIQSLNQQSTNEGLGLQPQFNIVNLPDDDKWNKATLGLQPAEPGAYVPGETDTSWSMTINKSSYAASFSVPNLDNFLNKYGENNYITLTDCVQSGMINKDFKFGFLYQNTYGANDVADILLHESNYNFDTYLKGWAIEPTDSTYSTFKWTTTIDTKSLSPFMTNENTYDITLLLTLYDQNGDKASVYDAFQTALIPDGMDEMFSLKIKDGYYFKWSGQYKFETPTSPIQNFDDWAFQGTKTKVLDHLSSDPVEQTFGEIVRPDWWNWDIYDQRGGSCADNEVADDCMYSAEKTGIIQRCELGQDTQEGNYVIKKVRLVDLMVGLRADHSKAEREDTDAWLSHYNFKTNFIWSSSQDTDIPMPTITKDDSCHLWLNIADFHWTNPFDLFPSFMGYIDLYNNDNQLCYEFSTMIGTQFGA